MRGFGDLEAAIMDRVWGSDQPVTVRDVYAQLAQDRPLAYTTVMTVMDNLHRKGYLAREMVGRAWRYRPTASREEYTAGLLRQVLDNAGDQLTALAHFVGAMNDDESQALRAALRRRSRRGPRP